MIQLTNSTCTRVFDMFKHLMRLQVQLLNILLHLLKIRSVLIFLYRVSATLKIVQFVSGQIGKSANLGENGSEVRVGSS